MGRASSIARAALAGAILVVAVTLGVSLHTIAALLEFTPSPRSDGDVQGSAAVSLATEGSHAVGFRRWSASEVPTPLTVWYPALDGTDTGSDVDPSAGIPAVTVRYAYGISPLDGGTTVALATYPGRAVPGAAPDHSGGPYPVVVLSPGFAMGAMSYGWLAEHLASHGFLVAAVHHAESLDPQNLWRATVDRPRDVSAALDTVLRESGPDGPLAGLVDLERTAVVGHSYGGYAALAAGGARLNTAELRAACESAGRAGGALALQCGSVVPHLDEIAARAGLDAVPSRDWPSWADPRVDAVVALAGDAMMFGADGLASLMVPVLAIGGTADRDSPFEWGTGAAFEHAATSRKVQVSLQGAEHLLFAGGCAAPRIVLDLVDTTFCSDPAWDQAAAHDLVAHYTTAFLLAEGTGMREVRSLLAANDQPTTPQLTYRAEGY